MIHLGDCLEVLKRLDTESVNTCVTSPPYWGLRDYGVEGQLGLEKTPQEFVEKMVLVFREVRRTLRTDGTLRLNLGDSYAQRNYGSCGGRAKDPSRYETGARGQGRSLFSDPGYKHGLKNKDLVGVPWRVALALQADGWYLRQDIIWAKPNPMPESVKDRCVKSHEYIFLLSKNPKYYFDWKSIREPVASSTIKRMSQDVGSQLGSQRVPGKTNGPMKAVLYGGTKYSETDDSQHRTKSGRPYNLADAKRSKRSVWNIPTRGFKGAHFATFPEKLIEPCVLAGSPIGGVVLDPFSGAGTTGVVCKRTGRNFIGIELNPDYREMALKRIDETKAPELPAQIELLEGA